MRLSIRLHTSWLTLDRITTISILQGRIAFHLNLKLKEVPERIYDYEIANRVMTGMLPQKFAPRMDGCVLSEQKYQHRAGSGNGKA